MQKLSVKNIILIAVAVAIIVVAFIVSRYENPNYYGLGGNGQDSIQLPVITASAASGSDPISYAGNWEKTLSTAVSGAWGNPSSSTIESIASLTPTDVFGRDLFTRYAQAENSGQDVTDPNVQQAIAGEVLSDGTVLSTPKLYSESDLKITQDNSTSSITAYGNAAGLVFVQNFMKHENELTIVEDSISNKNPAELKQLDPIIAEYQALLAGELAVTVPSSIADIHLDLVNALSELIFADQSFEKSLSDGLTSLNGLTAYKQGAADLNSGLSGIETYLNAANITYTTQDPGIIFTYKSQ